MSRITRKRAQATFFRSVKDSVLEGGREDAIERGPSAVGSRENPDAGDVDDRRRLMSAFSIDYDGRHYRYDGYRYDRLADAVSYAELMQSRQTQAEGSCAVTYHHVESPTASDKALMAAYSITFSEGVYGYSGFRYDRLADAVNYAEMLRRQHTVEPEK